MTTEEITEGNRLIAQFLGEELKNGMLVSVNNLFGSNTNTLHPMTYHSDWSEIMKAVEKIEKTYDDFHGYFGVHIHSNGCTIQGTNLRTNPENFHPAYFNEVYADTKLEATYICVVQFLMWYNNDQKNKRAEGEES